MKKKISLSVVLHDLTRVGVPNEIVLLQKLNFTIDKNVVKL
jgi:hypothetical protein